MELKRYDVIMAELKYKEHEGSSVQSKKRPYVIVGNTLGIEHSNIITIVPLTSKIKKLNFPVHTKIKADKVNGLTKDSMALGEQIQTISKNEVIEKLGYIKDNTEKNEIDRICFNAFFFGKKDWGKVVEEYVCN